jgi:DNA repair exonuclease SbcCD ATPase subunit
MTRSEKLARLREAIASARSEWLRREAKREELDRLRQQAYARLEELKKQLDLFDKVRVLLQTSSEYAREQAKQQMESLVTNALQYVFGSTFRFEIELSEHGGKPAAEFYVVTEWDGRTIRTKPQDARGGGVVDITSLALRVAMIETFRPRLDGPLILDEPGKHVSAEYVMPMVEFLKSAGEMFDRQIILVTHNPHLIEGADQAFHVRLQSGKTEVIPISRLDNGTG